MPPRISLEPRYLIRRFSLIIQANLLGVSAALAGIWVNWFTDHNGDFWSVGWGNTVLALSILAILLQLVVGRLEVRATRQDAATAIKCLLEVAARALVFPRDWTSIQIRAHCYLYNPKHDHLQPIAHCSSHDHADNWRPISCDVRHQERFVIVKAVRQVKDLNEEFKKRNALEREVGVWADLHTVLAAPVRVVGDETQVIGIVNFDSSLFEGEMKFGSQEAHDIAVRAAEGVALLWRSDYSKRSARSRSS